MSRDCVIDSSVFLEFEIVDKGYSEECDRLFENSFPKKTSVRISKEVSNIMRNREELRRDLIKHYSKNGPSKRFYPRRIISDSGNEFLQSMLEYVGKGNSGAILRRLNELYSMIEKGLEYRFSKILRPLFKESRETNLMNEL
jgi:hypothetical protein